MYRRVRNFSRSRTGRRVRRVGNVALTAASLYNAPRFAAARLGRRVFGGRFIGKLPSKASSYVGIDPWQSSYFSKHHVIV